MTARLGIFVSGTGRSMANIASQIEHGNLDADIALVLGSRPCPGIELAQGCGFETLVPHHAVDAVELSKIVSQYHLDFVVLAGYLNLLPIPEPLRGRVVNIHPALLPDFGGPGMFGTRVHSAVLDAFKRGKITESGCTVHLCDDSYDTGTILLQRRCPIKPNDTPKSLADRVFKLECKAYPEALDLLIRSNAPPIRAE